MFLFHFPVSVADHDHTAFFQVIDTIDQQSFLLFLREIMQHIGQDKSTAFRQGHFQHIATDEMQPVGFSGTVVGRFDLIPVIIDTGDFPSG